MALQSLYISNFRLYPEVRFHFGPSLNIIHGPNARGKTSLLEALFLLMTGRSFRSGTPHDMIRSGAPLYFLEASFLKNGLEHTLRTSFDGNERKIVYNNTVYPSSASLLGLLRGVVLAPDDAALIKGAPIVRRHYLDMQIAQVDPLYVHHLTRYGRAMKQRNQQLRSRRLEAIEAWEHEMAQSGAYVVQARRETVQRLNEEAEPLYSELTGDPQSLGAVYKSSAPAAKGQLAAYFGEQYQKLRRREMELGGVTLSGPHRDDLILTLEGREARYFGSEGQQRSCVAVLKLAEWMQMKRVSGETPALLIDDMGVSLDEGRRAALLEYVQQLGQVFLTATEPLSLPGHSIAL